MTGSVAKPHDALRVFGLQLRQVREEAGLTGRAVAARATGGRAWPDALAHPASVVAFAVLVVRSFRGRRKGALTWRGRPV